MHVFNFSALIAFVIIVVILSAWEAVQIPVYAVYTYALPVWLWTRTEANDLKNL
jgi:hypothetical protein